MAHFMIRMLGEIFDEVFDSREDAEDYALYLQGCAEEGAETLNLSNPGDNPYDPDDFEYPDYEIIEED